MWLCLFSFFLLSLPSRAGKMWNSVWITTHDELVHIAKAFYMVYDMTQAGATRLCLHFSCFSFIYTLLG